jgi:hypothetical protein
VWGDYPMGEDDMSTSNFVLHANRGYFHFKIKQNVVCYVSVDENLGTAISDSGFYRGVVSANSATHFDVQFSKRILSTSPKKGGMARYSHMSALVMKPHEFDLIKSDSDMRAVWLSNIPLTGGDRDLYVEFVQAIEQAHELDLERKIGKKPT